MKQNPKTPLSALIFALALAACTPFHSVAADTKAPEPAMVAKARSIVLPEFKLEGVTLSEALRRLSDASKQNDHDNKGVNFLVTQPAMAAANPKITLTLKNVTLQEATERIAKAAGLNVSAQDYGFVFSPKSDKP
jgi:hypothetical protein